LIHGGELGLAIEFDDSIFDAIEDGHQIVLLERAFHTRLKHTPVQ
jgi:hypothetical protein